MKLQKLFPLCSILCAFFLVSTNVLGDKDDESGINTRLRSSTLGANNTIAPDEAHKANGLKHSSSLDDLATLAIECLAPYKDIQDEMENSWYSNSILLGMVHTGLHVWSVVPFFSKAMNYEGFFGETPHIVSMVYTAFIVVYKEQNLSLFK